MRIFWGLEIILSGEWIYWAYWHYTNFLSVLHLLPFTLLKEISLRGTLGPREKSLSLYLVFTLGRPALESQSHPFTFFPYL